MRARQLNARTPEEVFFDPEIRIPRRNPDESFGYLFFDLVENGRIVGNNGVVFEGRIYRLVLLHKHLEYWGERVDVRVNPDDQRVAMIYDRRTGAYVCKALVDAQDATYDTRDEVTRRLIARVFSDGKQLLRMAKSHVEGSKERLPEYRRAKIEYLMRRAREIQAARKELRAEIKDAGVTVIGRYSALAREEKEEASELSAAVVAEILDADDAQMNETATPLCVVSKRTRKPRAKQPYQRREGDLRFTEIARILGTTDSSLHRYRTGITAWPEGMEARFEKYKHLRAGDDTDADH